MTKNPKINSIKRHGSWRIEYSRRFLHNAISCGDHDEYIYIYMTFKRRNSIMAKKKIKTKCRFLDHLEDLRWLLVRSTLAIVIMAFATYFFLLFVWHYYFGPVRPTFTTYQFFLSIPSLGLTDSFCITEFPFIIQNTSMEGQVNVFICLILWFILYFMGNMEIYKSCFTRMKSKKCLSFIFIECCLAIISWFHVS
jgi:hypothetical protein